jgi:hypothetical protein
MPMLTHVKQNPHIRTSVLGCLVAALSCAGCLASQGDDLHDKSAGPTASRSVLDREMLAAALDEQKSFEALGVSLKSRAWLRPDAYVANYQAAEGGVVGTQRIGTKSLNDGIDLPTRAEGESFADFEQRANAVDSRPVAELATDQLWFSPDQDQADPATRSDRVAVTSSALSDLEQIAQALAACDTMARRSCLSDTVGYSAQGSSPPVRMFDWAVSFGTEVVQMHGATGGATISRTPGGIASANGRGSAAFSAICTRGASSTFTVNVSRARFGLRTPASFAMTVAPVNFFGFVLGEGWNYNDCGFGNAMCSFRFDFNQANMTVRASEGGNLHTFCGQITDHSSINEADACVPRLGLHCGSFTFPSMFSSSSVSQ